MGQRTKNTTNGRKLAIQKETLRKLQLRTLSDEDLRAAAGGWNTGACGGPEAPSHCRC
ncbi:MAG TPA: hypothetical protein VFU21_27135 [Kofleriaceae bacterium]|nr:hypothetical protein [Kofleriaceae bacterium]